MCIFAKKKKSMKAKIFVGIWVIIFFGISCKENKKSNTEIDKEPQKISQNSDLMIIPPGTKPVVIDTFDNGKVMKVHFVDKNNPSEKYEKIFYQSGKVFIEGKLVNDKRDGLWLSYYENGTIWSLGNYSNGLRDGKSEVYYDNGRLRFVKNYKNDIPVGIWTFYDKNGDQVGEIEYENGNIVRKSGIFE